MKSFYFTRRNDIQALRGIAVVAVLLFHAYPGLFSNGYLGVDVFFVISGFVISPRIQNIFTYESTNGIVSKKINLYNFYKRRFYRLAPSATIVIVFTVIVVIFFAPASEIGRTNRQAISTYFLIGNLGAYKYSGNYFDDYPNALVHTWSISVEEQIYLFLPLVFLLISLLSKIKKCNFAKFLMVAIPLSLTSFLMPELLKIVYTQFGIEDPSQFSFYSAFDRIWQFAIGGILSFQKHSEEQEKFSFFRVSPALILIALLFSNFTVDIKIGSILATIIAVYTIKYMSLKNFLPKIGNYLKWIGDRSYSIYLIHLPVLFIVKNSPLKFFKESKNLNLHIDVAIILSIFIGSILYSQVENRFRIRDGYKVSLKKSFTLAVIIMFSIATTSFIQVNPFKGFSAGDMNGDRLSNSDCKFWIQQFDLQSRNQFASCSIKYGSATVILGDSHAMNIYNSFFSASKSPFILGLSNGGCHPYRSAKICPYSQFKDFLRENPGKVSTIIYHQSGSYLISDYLGDVDSKLAFEKNRPFEIRQEDIRSVNMYLDDIGKMAPTYWIGPFLEARINPTLLELLNEEIEINPFVWPAFQTLDVDIKNIYKEDLHNFKYISLLDNLGSLQFKIKSGSCIIFRDQDHWSLCGEELFGSILVKLI